MSTRSWPVLRAPWWVGAGLGLTLAACGPSPAELRAQLAQADLSVLDAVAGVDDPDHPQPVVDRARTLQAVLPQLDALAAAEGPMLQESVEEALAAGDILAAASRLAIAVEAGRTDVTEVSRAIEKEARAADPETEHRVLAALAEVWTGVSEAQAHRLRQDATTAAIRARYSADHIEAVRASQAGVTRAAAVALLEKVDREYVVTVDWTAAAQGAATRLGALTQSEGVRAAWPQVPGAVFVGGVAQSLDQAVAKLDAALAEGKRVGLPDEVVLDEWVTGALASLDPWTRAVWPAEIAEWSASHSGVYMGVGLVLNGTDDGRVVVDHPIPGAPAWTSGIHQGDEVLAMADPTGALRLADLPAAHRLDVARAALNGPPDTELRLEVRAPGTADTRVIHLIRGPVVEETVEGWARDAEDNHWLALRDSGVAYVRISRFKPSTEAAFDALLEPHLDDIRAVVLDLRGNPGGDVNSAVQIADRFVADGWLANLTGRVLPDTGPDTDPTTGEPLAEWNQAIPGHALEGVPVAVLVDDQTASAAEVLAGALQERADAVVVGRATWGKGLAQALRTADDGTFAVQFTNVVWTLPSGRQLSRRMDGGGIQPDLPLDLGPASRFQLQVDRARRSVLRVHADGTPLTMDTPAARQDLPPLDADPAVVAAELVLLARRSPKSDK